MVKGRKPKPDAQRRGGAQPVAVEIIESPATVPQETAISKPAYIADNPIQSECWDTITGTSCRFSAEDKPLLEAYCYWYAVLRQATSQTITADGKVITLSGKKVNGVLDPKTVRQNPDLKTAAEATNMLRLLGDALNLNQAARSRAGVMSAVARSTQMDIVRKTIAGYEEFRKMMGGTDASR